MSTRVRPATRRLEDLVVGPEVGDGGEGAVHDVHVPGAVAPMVLKRYLGGLDATRRDHLAHLVSLRPHLRHGIASMAWPEALVADGDQVVGVLLPRAPGRFWAPMTLRSGREQQRLREVQYLLFGADKLDRLGLPFPTLTQRMELLAALVAAIGRLHAMGLVYGDVSARNVLYALDGAPEVFLLDCDGITPAGTSYVIDSPDWVDPDGSVVARPASDVHKLGLLAVRMLVLQPTLRTLPPRGAVPAPLVDTLGAMLDQDAGARPTIEEVAVALEACTPGPTEDARGSLPQWGLREGTGDLVLLEVPDPPAPPARRGRGRWAR